MKCFQFVLFAFNLLSVCISFALLTGCAYDVEFYDITNENRDFAAVSKDKSSAHGPIRHVKGKQFLSDFGNNFSISVSALNL